ncbi:MAG: glycosyltransferase [Actinobacteria bacterium]|nr:glycosyltransferase [Actinomycetota bacterium]
MTRPRVVVATTNFPLQRRGDRTGTFVVDPVLALADEVDQVVIMPNDAQVGAPRERWADRVPVIRFNYWWPRSAMCLAHGDGIPTNLQRSWLARAQLVPMVVLFAWWIVRLARRADVVHAHWLPVALLALPARWLWGTPIAVTVHGTDITQFPDGFLRWALRQVDVVVSAHDDLLSTVEDLAPGTRTERIRHLVQPQPADPDGEGLLDRLVGDAPMALFVARLSPERDPVTFVRAAPHVLDEVPDAHLVVVGDGPVRTHVEAEVERLGLGGLVHIVGHRPDVWTFYRRADVFAAVSDRNNVWVTVVVEAMRASVPVVATTAGVTAETLQDRHDAMLVPVGDPPAVGRAIAELLTDDELHRRVAANAADTLRREGFDPGEVRDRTVRLYRELAR